jgi:hypothetical protein
MDQLRSNQSPGVLKKQRLVKTYKRRKKIITFTEGTRQQLVRSLILIELIR